MVWVFYGCLIAGLGLLLLDVGGRLTVAPARIPLWRAVGLVAAGAAGLAPALVMVTDRTGWSWPFPVIATAYLVAFLVFASGLTGLAGTRGSLFARRVGYLGLLLLNALPSWVLLFLSPAVLLAGAGLAVISRDVLDSVEG